MPSSDDTFVSAPTKIGSINVGLYLSEGGIDVSYSFDGVTKDAAIGYLTVVTDRMREERKYEWSTCPECREPWASHHHMNDDEEDDDDL